MIKIAGSGLEFCLDYPSLMAWVLEESTVHSDKWGLAQGA